ncbi:dentin sialophosphoprotein-like [Vespa crabro]|uniref:dentin sialophosphoprotein-like n=1 Tax=Vespa crabro TaxID=7445 RepID=UPI001F004EEC|nr:dentin sialophosphoprotein-like [Vespa crabro]
MAFSELEERISKIRQQNEEIKRRHEEVEEDKKNAAKLNALVQMVPSTDWPERKEPPEYSNLPKVTHKQKSATKEQLEHGQQHHPNDRRKGEGPPPDPKYNFLADAEREEYSVPNQKDNTGNKNHNRSIWGNFKKRGMGREGQQRGRTYHGAHRDEHKPEYEAWRKERNRIDEDRISRQKTAEGNWRREWDNDKAHLVNEISKAEGKITIGDFTKKDGRYSDGSGYAGHNRGAYHKSYRGSPRNFHNNHDYHHMNSYDQHNHDMSSMSLSVDERTVVATDKSIKVTLNQSNMTKGPLMSVKVNSPSIAGTGRVGLRQRTRVSYSSHSDMDTNTYESGSFPRQKSFEDKTKGNHYNNMQRTPSLRRPQSQKKKENGAKSPFLQRKEFRKEISSANSSKHYENGSQQNFVRKEYKDSQKFHYPPKSPRASHKNMKISKNESVNVTNDSTIKDEKKVIIKIENDTSIESQKVNIESSNEIRDDGGSSAAVVENESKSDTEEYNDVILNNSECSPCKEETTNEKNTDSNVKQEEDQDHNVNFISLTNQDSVSICEDKQCINEETNEDNSIVSSQDINKDVKSASDEKNEIDNAITIIDNAITNSCNSDNNTNTHDIGPDINRVDTKIDLVVQDNVSNTSDEKTKESPENNSNQSDKQNDIVAMSCEKVSEIIVETCSEALPVTDTSVLAVEEYDVTHHNNEVPVESINNINDKNIIKNSEDTLPISIDKVSSNPADITKDNNETSEEVIEKKELQTETVESVAEDKGIESEVTQDNSEN